MTVPEGKEQSLSGIEPLLSIEEVGRLLQISESGVYRLMRSGELATVKIGGRTRIEPAAVRELISAQRDPRRPSGGEVAA